MSDRWDGAKDALLAVLVGFLLVDLVGRQVQGPIVLPLAVTAAVERERGTEAAAAAVAFLVAASIALLAPVLLLLLAMKDMVVWAHLRSS